MDYSIKKSGAKAEIMFVVDAEEFNAYYEKTLISLSQNLKMDGFRPGKVPSSIVEDELGMQRILEEAANLTAREKYVEAIIEEKLEVIGKPEIEVLKIAKNNPFEFKATLSFLPEIKLPDYRLIASKTKRKEPTVNDKEMSDAVSWLQKSRAKLTLKQGPAAKNDWVEINLKMLNQTAGKEEAPIKDAFVLGEGKLVPGLEEQLEGMRAGEEKEISVTFPANHYRKDLAGKAMKMSVKMETVQNRELPEINDDFAKSLGAFQDLNSLRNNIEEGLLAEKKTEESQRLRGEIIEKIAESSSLEIPEILIQSEKEKMLENLKMAYSAPDAPTSFEAYLKESGKSEKDILDTFTSEAEKRIKSFLVLREISKKENIEASADEINQQIKRILNEYNDIEKAKNELDPAKLREYAEGVLRNEKVFEMLEKLTK